MSKVQRICKYLDEAKKYYADITEVRECIDWLKSLEDRVLPQPKQKWKQENTDDLTDFENAMMHIGESFFGKNAGLDPNDINAIKEQANTLLGFVPSKDWSEEDEEHIESILKRLDGMCKKGATFTKTRFAVNQDMDWLKSLRPQPKQEWNKRDMEMLNAAISFVEHSSFTTIGKGKNNTVAWLKSLKSRVIPQLKQEWSEEDETKMRAALAFIKSEFPKKGNEEIMEDTIEWLKSRKTHKTWKPSKGQLECLGYAIDKAKKDYSPLANNRIYLTLKALKKELEKLTE